MTTHNQLTTPATARQSLLRRGHKYVTLAFRRKRDGKHGEKAGDVRVMTCRLHVGKFTKGVIDPAVRKAEDKAHDTLTVWDVQAFHSARRAGKSRKVAGKLRLPPRQSRGKCCGDQNAGETMNNRISNITESDLKQFTGSEHWYRHWTGKLVYTDGIHFLCRKWAQVGCLMPSHPNGVWIPD